MKASFRQFLVYEAHTTNIQRASIVVVVCYVSERECTYGGVFKNMVMSCIKVLAQNEYIGFEIRLTRSWKGFRVCEWKLQRVLPHKVSLAWVFIREEKEKKSTRVCVSESLNGNQDIPKLPTFESFMTLQKYKKELTFSHRERERER